MVIKDRKMKNLTDGRGIKIGDFAIIDGITCNYEGFDKDTYTHYFTNDKTLRSLRECFKARMRYYG